MTSAYLFALVNMVLSIAVLFISLCRINAMGKNVMFRVQLEYTCWVGAAVTSGLQPWWGEWPEWGAIASMGAILVYLISSAHAWRNDRPPESATGPIPLE